MMKIENSNCPPLGEMRKIDKESQWRMMHSNWKIWKGQWPFFQFSIHYSLLSAFVLFSVFAYASSYQDWLQKIGKQKIRKVYGKHTAVAAVRGVDEPGEVDKGARNYQAVSEMEKKTIPYDKLLRFIQEGKLILFGQDG